MKVSPVSGDLLVKIAIVAVAGGVMYVIAKRGASLISSLTGNAWSAIAAVPGQVVDAAQQAVTVTNPPLADTGVYSDQQQQVWQAREAAAAAGTPVSGWDKFKYDITHIFNTGS